MSEDKVREFEVVIKEELDELAGKYRELAWKFSDLADKHIKLLGGKL